MQSIFSLCRQGDLDTLKVLCVLSPGTLSQRTSKGQSPFFISALYGKLECLKWIFEQDPGQVKDRTPLHVSVGHPECFKFILEKDPSQLTNKGVLTAALAVGHVEVLQLMFEKDPELFCQTLVFNEQEVSVVTFTILECLRHSSTVYLLDKLKVRVEDLLKVCELVTSPKKHVVDNFAFAVSKVRESLKRSCLFWKCCEKGISDFLVPLHYRSSFLLTLPFEGKTPFQVAKENGHQSCCAFIQLKLKFTCPTCRTGTGAVKVFFDFSGKECPICLCSLGEAYTSLCGHILCDRCLAKVRTISP